MKTAQYGVFVGRFQPFHTGHLKVFIEALRLVDTIIIVVGSARASISIKNPWTFEERKEMIEKVLHEWKDRVKVVPLRDSLYSNQQWIVSLNNLINRETNGSSNIMLLGHKKDKTSYYLDFFPQWQFHEVGNYFKVNATDIREKLLSEGELSKDMPDHVRRFVALDMERNPERYETLRKEREYLNAYKARWSNTPYPVTFMTTDVVVIKSAHVLVVRRGIHPGKGMFALPGGFLGTNETLIESALRELKEETKIAIPKHELKRSIKAQKIFDHPERSLRGRTITSAFLIELEGGGNLPEVSGSDDAAEALWIPLSDITLYEEKFFEDHVHIIKYFAGKV